MHMISHSDPRNFPALTCKLLLGACWIAGLLLGMYAAVTSGNSFLLMMRGDVSTVSIPGLLITFLPFLLTAIAVLMPHPGYLIPVILWKAFSFGYSACGLTIAYHSAAWLVRFLLMFNQLATVPLLMWLWLRKCDFPEFIRPVELAVCGGVTALVGLLDYCLISPFAAVLL